MSASEPAVRRHADHDPSLTCRPALGYGLCELLETGSDERNEMSAAGIYRVMFETVNQVALRKYCNADPVMFKNTTQTVPNSQIPDEDWHPVEGRATDNPWQQYNQLRQWESRDREFVRNVRLERMVSKPEWEEVERP